MRKKMGTMSSTKTGKARGKVADLTPKTLKGGAAAAVKGGAAIPSLTSGTSRGSP